MEILQPKTIINIVRNHLKQIFQEKVVPQPDKSPAPPQASLHRASKSSPYLPRTLIHNLGIIPWTGIDISQAFSKALRFNNRLGSHSLKMLSFFSTNLPKHFFTLP